MAWGLLVSCVDGNPSGMHAAQAVYNTTNAQWQGESCVFARDVFEWNTHGTGKDFVFYKPAFESQVVGVKMIVGIGIDIVDINRMEESLHEAGFQAKVFTAAELDGVRQYRNKSEHLAGKFAAKEAFMKAIGAGLRQEVWFTQIEVLNDEAGKPSIRSSGEAAKRLGQSGASQVHLSISHSAGVAVAVVILES